MSPDIESTSGSVELMNDINSGKEAIHFDVVVVVLWEYQTNKMECIQEFIDLNNNKLDK